MLRTNYQSKSKGWNNKMDKLKIIIADDNRQIAEFSKSFLERIGQYDVLGIAFNSTEEIELIEKYSPDVVITDIVRKGESVSGLDIALKYEEEKKSVKFILVTASGMQDILYKTNYKLPSNVISYLKKPFDWNLLIKEIEKASIMKYIEEHRDDEYYTKGIVNIASELSSDLLEIINKLDVEIEDKVYTKNEYDMLKMDIFRFFYEEEDEDEELIEEIKNELEERGISETEYKNILNAFDEIDAKYLYNK